ncbi:MAG: APC family permease [Burkholderiaceae bacterium]|nr:APC family permease [Burkholderiaceae bacterium]
MTGTAISTPAASAARRGRGVRALFAAAIGVIVAQIGMVSVLQGLGIAGWGFVVALGIAFALALANALAYAELSLMLPSAGSLSTFAEAALGNFPAILLVFAGYITPAIFGLPAELILVDQIVAQALPVALPPFAWAVALVVVFAALNVLGTDVFARVQTALGFTVLAFLLVTGAAALLGGGVTAGAGGVAPAAAAPEVAMATLSRDTVVLGIVALAFWIFMGIEFVTPLVTEAADARRDLPRAMVLGLVAIVVAELLFALGAARYLTREQLATSATPHLDAVVAVFGPHAKSWFAALALVASASLVNTVLAAVPRMLWGMAMNGQVFPVFKRLHPRHGTPVAAIVFVAALPLAGLAWSGGSVESILPLMIAASMAWLFAYMLAQVSLLVLRRRHPEWPRPFRVPGAPFVPLAAIAGMAVVVANGSPAPELTPQIVRYTGIVLGVFALVGALWVKLAMKRGLFEPVEPELASLRRD